MVSELEELYKRVDKIERQADQEVLALVEILSNATFFGEIKKTLCEYAKNGQCGFFILEGKAKNKIPIATECRIRECKEPSFHCHIEISSISCTLCQKESGDPENHFSQLVSDESKNGLQKAVDFHRIGK